MNANAHVFHQNMADLVNPAFDCSQGMRRALAWISRMRLCTNRSNQRADVAWSFLTCPLFFLLPLQCFFHFLLPRIYLWELMLNKIHMQRKAKWVKMEGVCRNRRWEVDFDAAVSCVQGLLPETNAKSFRYNLSLYMWWVSAVILFIYLEKNEWFGLRGHGRFLAWKISVFWDLFLITRNDVEICIFLRK